ncbi:MAG: hypothetical protein MMC33_005878 [Icmadophila ericetorum]|nr:hypothetical protein [Icmadophila ericetorum]
MHPSPLGRFEDLPQEVRQMIWGNLVPLPAYGVVGDVDDVDDAQPLKPKLPERFSIMRTSIALHEELGRELYFEKPLFLFLPYLNFFRVKERDFAMSDMLNPIFKLTPWERFDTLQFIIQPPWKFQHKERVALLANYLTEIVEMLLPREELPCISFRMDDLVLLDQANWIENDEIKNTLGPQTITDYGIMLDYAPNDVNQILSPVRRLANLPSVIFQFSNSWRPFISRVGWQKAIEALVPLQDFSGTRPKPIQFTYAKTTVVDSPYNVVLEILPRPGSHENKRLIVVQSNTNYLTREELVHGPDWGKHKTKVKLPEYEVEATTAFNFMTLPRHFLRDCPDCGCMIEDAKYSWPDLEPLTEDHRPTFEAGE